MFSVATEWVMKVSLSTMSDQQNYTDFREEMEARFPNTPLIAEVSQPSPHASKIYGPFANGKEAMEWLLTVPMNVRVGFRPLRNPNIERTYHDFFAPDHLLDQDKEYSNLVTPNA